MLKRLCLALGLSVLSVPSFAKDVALPMPLAEQLPVEVQLTQHEITIDVPDYASGLGIQFGLVGALIGSSIENSQGKKGEIALLPVRNMMVNYDFEQRLVTALTAGLPGSGVSTQPLVSVAHVPWEGRTDLQNMPSRALVIRPRYALDDTMSAMYVKLQVTLEDREVRNGKVRTRVAFTRPYSFRATLAQPVPNQTGPWTALGADRLAQLMDQAVDQSVAILLYDFSADGRQQWGQKIKGRTSVGGKNVPGRLERRDGDATWVRAGNKHVQSLTAYQTVRSGQLPVYQPVGQPPVADVAAAAAVVTPQVAAVEAVPAVPAAPAAATAPSNSTFWNTYRPKDAPSTPATTP